MTKVLADNITSPLGMTTQENYEAVKAGRSALRRYDGLWGLQEPFTASLFTDAQWSQMAIEGLTRFETLVVTSVRQAVEQLPIDISSPSVLFILSTTKANVELLQSTKSQSSNLKSQSSPGAAAQRIARKLGFTTTPVVVCNACISGVAAIILAQRLLNSGQYDYAVVCGADVQNRFTISGFQSLKAVSANDCRPFDMERTGLNLGEAAATVVMGSEISNLKSQSSNLNPQISNLIACLGVVEAGTIRNDAYHISSPSKNGEGAWLALTSLTSHHSNLNTQISNLIAFINAHGTATMFNDQMESVAIERAGLADIPVNGLKGYYGHTLGAAGVLETVISLAALRDHTVLATRGFAERGVSGKIKVTTETTALTGNAFVKMISGFGGSNAAIVVRSPQPPSRGEVGGGRPVRTTHRVTITPTEVTVDGQHLSAAPPPRGEVGGGREVGGGLTELYKHFVGDYPKFYKMDPLSRLGFLASELLLQAEKKSFDAKSQSSNLKSQSSNLKSQSSPQSSVSRAVVFFNSSSSIATDRKYMETIATDNYFPSPSVFLYTLPNIVTGEIAMRNNYHGETSFFILPRRDDGLMNQIALSTFQDREVKSIITGWLDYYDDQHFTADLSILQLCGS
jgi:3-oxoacyl-[acyl-carrier-protein] synthase-1